MRGGMFTILVAMVLGSKAFGQIIETGSQTPPSEQEIIDLIGQPMSDLFAKFGYPRGVAVRGPQSGRYIHMSFGDFGFHVRDKRVIGCRFDDAKTWSVKGVRLFDAIDDVEQKLGKPVQKIKNADGSGTMEWVIEGDRRFKVVFTTDQKCIGMQINEPPSKK